MGRDTQGRAAIQHETCPRGGRLAVVAAAHLESDGRPSRPAASGVCSVICCGECPPARALKCAIAIRPTATRRATFPGTSGDPWGGPPLSEPGPRTPSPARSWARVTARKLARPETVEPAVFHRRAPATCGGHLPLPLLPSLGSPWKQRASVAWPPVGAPPAGGRGGPPVVRNARGIRAQGTAGVDIPSRVPLCSRRDFRPPSRSE
jgi:hypothetical protein